MRYFVYMVTCTDGSIYTGYTRDLQKRIDQHNSKTLGSKYTRSRQPVKLAYVEIYSSQREAIKRERELKTFNRIEKLLLIEESKKNSSKNEHFLSDG